MLVTRARLVIVSALGIFCVSPAARADTVLHYQFKEGETLPYTMEQKMKMEMNGGGVKETADMNQTIDASRHIKSVDKDGKAKIVMKFDRIRITANGFMGKFEYDSKNGKLPEGPISKRIGPIMEALAGAEFSLTMDARGQFSDLKMPEKLSEAFKELPGGGLGGDIFSEDGIKHMISEAGLTLPEGTATKGKSWNKEVTLKILFGKMKINNTSTYEGPTTRDGTELEQISLQPKMTIEADDKAPFTLNLKSQDAKGTAYFDNKAGRLVETKMTQTTEMEVSAMGQTFIEKIEQTVTMKLNEKAK
jgi:uncharacterized protein YajQ (UPF0234 family)